MIFKLTLKLSVLVLATITFTLILSPLLGQHHLFACRLEAQPMNLRARERGWYLIDHQRLIAAPERLDVFPYPFMLLSPDFSLGITEAIQDDTIQPELFLHLSGMRFRRNNPITDDGTRERFFDWSPDSTHVLFNRLDRSGRGRSGLYIIDVKDNTVRRLTEKQALQAFWSSDGKQVFYYTSFEGYKLLDIESGEIELIEPYMGSIYDYGTRALIKGERRKTGIEGGHFVILDPHTGEAEAFQPDIVPAENAIWNDDTHVIYKSPEQGTYMLDVNTRAMQRIDSGVTCDNIATWTNPRINVPCNRYAAITEQIHCGLQKKNSG